VVTPDKIETLFILLVFKLYNSSGHPLEMKLSFSEVSQSLQAIKDKTMVWP
jgi:hypothetical protein